MSYLTALATFAEDIREETPPKFSLIGVMPDILAFPEFPATLPKLGISVRINCTLDCPSADIDMMVIEPDGTQFQLGHIPASSVDEARETARKNGFPYLGFGTRALAVPYRIPNAGYTRVTVKMAQEEVLAGTLKMLSHAEAELEAWPSDGAISSGSALRL